MALDRPGLILTLDGPDAARDPRLAALLDSGCLFGIVGSDQELRNACRDRVAFFVDDDPALIKPLDAEGILLKNAKSVAAMRKLTRDDFLIGAHCGISRHEGMVAGEAGADYLLTGDIETSTPATADQLLEMVRWASDLTTLPVAVCGFDGLVSVDRLIDAGANMFALFDQEAFDIVAQAVILAEQLGWLERGIGEI